MKPPIRRLVGKSLRSNLNHRRTFKATVLNALGSIKEAIAKYPLDVAAQVLEELKSEGDETLKLISKALSHHDIPPAILDMVKSMNASSRQNNNTQGRQTMLTLALVVLKPYLRDGGKVELKRHQVGG